MRVLNSLEHFNHYFSQVKNEQSSSSLVEFFRSVVQERLPLSDPEVLDLGCGTRSIFEDLNLSKDKVIAIDFSDVAILKTPANTSINYLVVDLRKENAFGGSKFDLIFDSHCLHCILGRVERKTALNNILNALNDDGIFSAEMMIQKAHRYVSLPFKHIPTALDLEQELLECGFKIIYFLISPGMVFHNENGECDIVRVICRK